VHHLQNHEIWLLLPRDNSLYQSSTKPERDASAGDKSGSQLRGSLGLGLAGVVQVDCRANERSPGQAVLACIQYRSRSASGCVSFLSRGGGQSQSQVAVAVEATEATGPQGNESLWLPACNITHVTVTPEQNLIHNSSTRYRGLCYISRPDFLMYNPFRHQIRKAGRRRPKTCCSRSRSAIHSAGLACAQILVTSGLVAVRHLRAAVRCVLAGT
jgi:hypothetical protein